MISVAAPAKVNLRLRILAREDSGYHSLETLFCAVSLSDEVRVERGESGIALEVEGADDLGPPEDNLVVRAARRYYAGRGGEPRVRILLKKRIPAAAGLGGGSSDAAATLRALDLLHGRTGGGADLLQWAAELGSDVPFFLCGSTLALAWSRGERLLSLPPLPTRPVLIAYPGAPTRTGEAFAAIASNRPPGHGPAAAVISLEQLGGWTGVAALAENDFERPAGESIPLIRRGLADLRESGAFLATVAGSGSSIFGVFDSGAERDSATGRLSALGFTVWPAATLDTVPPVGSPSG